MVMGFVQQHFLTKEKHFFTWISKDYFPIEWLRGLFWFSIWLIFFYFGPACKGWEGLTKIAIWYTNLACDCSSHPFLNDANFCFYILYTMQVGKQHFHCDDCGICRCVECVWVEKISQVYKKLSMLKMKFIEVKIYLKLVFVSLWLVWFTYFFVDYIYLRISSRV